MVCYLRGCSERRIVDYPQVLFIPAGEEGSNLQQAKVQGSMGMLEESAAPSTHPLISVVVCTYNRAELLSGCLRSLEHQTVGKELYEVIIVDNNSTDATQTIARRFGQENSNFRVVVESRQGVARARNRGWREARSGFVAYIDDDARAKPEWCARIMEFIRKRPDVAGFGGPYLSCYFTDKPKWYKDEYGSWSLPGGERPMRQGEFVRGTNMVFRRDVLPEVGGFDETLGHVGENIAYGEEPNLHARLIKNGEVIYYCPDIVVEHLVTPQKMDVKWMLSSAYKAGSVAPKMFQMSWPWARAGAALLWHVILLPIRLFSFSERYIQNRILSAFTGMAWHFGTLMGLIRKPSRPEGF